MLQNLLKNRKGFTLIEVVIVLAIAGLIFVIVFLAVSQAQASRRDTQRKTALDQLIAAANQAASNNNGNAPSDSWCGATSISTACTSSGPPTNGYWTPGTDPSGATYVNGAVSASGIFSAPAAGQVHFEQGATCDATGGGYTANSNNRTFAAVMFQERGGQVCVDSE